MCSQSIGFCRVQFQTSNCPAREDLEFDSLQWSRQNMTWPIEETEGWLHQQAMYQSKSSACWRLWATSSTHRACCISMGPSLAHPLSLISRTTSIQFHRSHNADWVRHWLCRPVTIVWQWWGSVQEKSHNGHTVTAEGLQEDIRKPEVGWEYSFLFCSHRKHGSKDAWVPTLSLAASGTSSNACLMPGTNPFPVVWNPAHI